MKPVTKVVIGGSLLVLSGYDVWCMYSYEQQQLLDYPDELLYGAPVSDDTGFSGWEQAKQPHIDVDEILETAKSMVYWYSRPIIPVAGAYLTASGIKAL